MEQREPAGPATQQGSVDSAKERGQTTLAPQSGSVDLGLLLLQSLP